VQKIPTFSTEEIFIRLLKNKSKTNYWRYISELRQRRTLDIYQKAVGLTKLTDKNEKIIGINVLAQFGYPRKHKTQTLKTYFDLLKKEKDINVISSTLYGIGHNNENLTDIQINLLCNYQYHKSATIRYSLIFALLGIENKNAINTLIKLSKDKDLDIRDWATFGIGSQIEADNLEIREALWERVTDTDKNTRDEAIAGLAKRKDQRVKEILKKELDEADNFSSLTLEAIENFNDKEFIKLIEQKIQKNKTEQTVNEDWLKITLSILENNKNDN
jgi:hypothetical protein